MICNIIPKVFDTNGNIVESKLFSELWNKSKVENVNTLDARNKAIQGYKLSTSTNFLDTFGDWTILRDYKLDTLTSEQMQRLISLYDGDIGRLERILEGKLNEQGEPKTEHVLNFKITKAELSLDVNNLERTYNNSDVHHMERLLSKYALKLIQKETDSTLEIKGFKHKVFDLFLADATKIANRLEAAETALGQLQESDFKGVDPEAAKRMDNLYYEVDRLHEQLQYIDVMSDALETTDFFWDRFFEYFRKTYDIKLGYDTKTETQIFDETDAESMQRSSSWEDSLSITFNKEKSVTNKIKIEIGRIQSLNHNTNTGIAENLDLSDVWSSLITEHKYDTGNPEKILRTLTRIANTRFPELHNLINRFENDADLFKAYLSSTNLALPENKIILTTARNNIYTVASQLNNRHSFPETKVYDKYIESINTEFSSKTSPLTKYVADNKVPPKLSTSGALINNAITTFKEMTGITLLDKAIKYHFETNDGRKAETRKSEFYGLLNRIMADVYNIKKSEAEEYKSSESDVRGDLMTLAKIMYPFSDVRPNTSYFSVDGNMEQTPQYHSYLTSMFSNLHTAQDVHDRFIDFTKDIKNQYDNFLWNTAPADATPNGVFDYMVDPETKRRFVPSPESVNMKFINRVGYGLFGGIKDRSEGIASKYDQLLNDNWALNTFVQGIFNNNFVSSSDSGRTFQLQLPKVDIFEDYQTGPDSFDTFVKFDEFGNFKSIDNQGAVYEALNNTVMQEISEFIAARDTLFDVVDGGLVVKDRFKGRKHERHLLRRPKHWDGVSILDNKGNPTGRVFKFWNMSYVDNNGNAVYLHDYIKINHPNSNYLLANNETDFNKIVHKFINDVLKHRIEQYINRFSPIKGDLYKLATYFEQGKLKGKELIAEQNKHRLIQNEVDFQKQIASFMINDYLSRVTIDNLVLGNQNEYVNTLDRNKRVGHGIKNYISMVSNEYDFKTGISTPITYSSLTINDINVKSNIAQSLKGIVSEEILNHYNKDITSTDGLIIITEAEFIRRLKNLGRYDLYKTQIEDIQNPDKEFDPTKYNSLIESQKFFMYSRQIDDSLYPQMVSRQHKSSTIVLFDKFTRGTQLGELHDFMKKSKLDQVAFSSAVKLSGVSPITLDNNGKFKAVTSGVVSKYRETLNYSDIGVQVDSKTHILDEVIKLGVQISRLATNGINFTEAIYNLSDEHGLTGQDIFDIYHELVSDNIDDSATSLLNEWGALDAEGDIKYDSDGHIMIDETKLLKSLKDLVVQDTRNENILRAISDSMVEGRPNMPIYSANLYKKFISILFSKIRNKITDQKMPGIHANLVPDVFLGLSKALTDKQINFESLSENRQITLIDRVNKELIKTGDYKLKVFTRKLNGKDAIVAEVILNPWLKTMFKNGQVIDINTLSEEERTMLGIRIPTENNSSMIILEVVGFLNNGASQAVFPSDLITKTGWDFDLDSVFMYRKNVKVNKKTKKYEIVKYDTDPKNRRNRYNDYIYERIYQYDANANNLGKRVINDIQERSQELYENYLDRTSNFDYKTKAVEELIFEEVNNLDEQSIEKQFKIFAKGLNDVGIKNSFDRALEYREFIETEIEYIEDQLTEYDNSNTTNYFLEEKHNNFLHMDKVVNDILDQFATRNELRAEMQSAQRKEWSNLKDKIVDAYVKEYGMISFENFEMLPTSKQNTRKARQNRILDTLMAIIANPEHHDALMRSNKYDNITKAGDIVNGLWGIHVDNLNTNFFVEEEVLRNINISTRELKGHAVSFVSLASIIGVVGARLNNTGAIRHAIPIAELGDKYKDMSESRLEQELSKYYDEGAVNIKDGIVYIKDARIANNPNKTWTDIYDAKIQDQTSEVVANILDAVKNLMGFNINELTLSVFQLLSSQPTTYMLTDPNTGTSSPNRFIMPYMFTHQPIIVDLVKMYNRSEISTAVPSVYKITNDTRNEYLVKFVLLHQEELKIMLKDKGTFVTSLINNAKNKNSVYLGKPSSKEYQTFYQALNHIAGKHNLNYSQDGNYYHTVNELENNIKTRVKYGDTVELKGEEKAEYSKFLIDQLRVLNSFRDYYALGNKLVNLASALKFDKADTPTFADTTKLLNAVNNAVLNLNDVAEILNSTSVPSSDIYRLIEDLKHIINPKDRVEYLQKAIKTLEKETGEKILMPDGLFEVDGKELVSSILPSLYESGEQSIYPMMDAYFRNNVILSRDIFSKLLLFESTQAHTQGTKGYGNIKNRILINNGLLGKEKVENVVNNYILGWAVKDIPFFNNYKVDNTGNMTAEIGRLLNVEGNALVTTKLSQFENIEDFRKLSLTEKIAIVKDAYFDGLKFTNVPHSTNILNLLILHNKVSDHEANGYHYITFDRAEVSENLVMQSIKDMYLSNNEFLRDTAEDIIKYAFYMYGMTFGNNLSRVIPVELLYDNSINPKVEPSNSPGIYASRLREELVNNLEGNIDAVAFADAFHRAKWNNRALNPLALPYDYKNKQGNTVRHFGKPMWDIETYNEKYNIIVEPTEFVRSSKYASKDYVLVLTEDGDSILHARYENGKKTFYFPVVKTLPFEFGDTAVLKYKEGILSQQEYIQFINEAEREGVFDEAFKIRIGQKTVKRTINQGNKLPSGVIVESTPLHIPSADVINNLDKLEYHVSLKELQAGNYEVFDNYDFTTGKALRLAPLGKAKMIGNSVYVERDGRSTEYTKEEFIKLVGYSDMETFRDSSKSYRDFITGKKEAYFYKVDGVVVADKVKDTSEQESQIEYYEQMEQHEVRTPTSPTQTKTAPSENRVLNPFNNVSEEIHNIYNDIEKSKLLEFFDIHSLAYFSGQRMNLDYYTKNKNEAKLEEVNKIINDFLTAKDNAPALKFFEDRTSNANIIKSYAVAYHNLAIVNNEIKNALIAINEDVLPSFKNVSPELNKVIVEAIKTVSSTLKSKSEVNLGNEIIETNQGLSELTKNISNESDFSIYIGDRSDNISDRFVKSNMNNPINIDISNDVISEVKKLVTQLPDKGTTLFISGDNYNSIRYTETQVDRYINNFIKTLRQEYPFVYNIKSIVKDGIGNALNNNNIANITFFETTGGKERYVFAKLPTVKSEVNLEHHNNKNERLNNKYLRDKQKLDKQIEVLEESRENAVRLLKKYTDITPDESIAGIRESVSAVSNANIREAINNYELSSMNVALHSQLDVARHIKSRVESLISDLDGQSMNKLFKFDHTFINRAPFVESIKEILDLLQSLNFIEDLHTLGDAHANIPELKGVTPERIKYHDDTVLALREVDNEIDTLRDAFHAIKDRYIHSLVMYITTNPLFPSSAYNLAREYKVLDYDKITVQEIQNDLKTLFEHNEDLSFMMMWTDSVFDTGITLIDSVLKEYFSSRAAKNRLVSQYTDRFYDLLADYLGVKDKKEIYNITSEKYKNQRVDAFSRLVNKDTGQFLSDYNWGEFDLNFQLHLDKVRELKERMTELQNEYDLTESEEIGEQLHELYKERKELWKNWNDNNTVQDESATELTQAEKEALIEPYNRLSEQAYRKYTRGLRFEVSDYNENTVRRIIPHAKYKSDSYSKLTQTDKIFINSMQSIIQEIAKTAYPSLRLSDTFIPVAVDMSSRQAWKTIAGIRPISKPEYYMGLNNELVYQTKIPMLHYIQNEREYNIRHSKPGETKQQYEQNVVNEINERFKLKEGAFKSFADIRKANRNAYLNNAKHTAKVRSYDPATIMRHYISQTLDFKHRQDFEKLYKLLLHEVGSDRFKVQSVRRGKNLIDTLKTGMRGTKQVVTESGMDTDAYARLNAAAETFANQSKITNHFDQILGSIKQYTSLLYMGLNVYGGIKNVTKGMHDMIMEAVSGEFISSDNLKWGIANYPAAELMKSVGSERVADLNTAIIRRHHTILELKNEKGIEVSDADKEAHRILMIHDAAYFANRITEHFMQYTMLLATTKSHRVVGGRAMTLQDYIGERRQGVIKRVIGEERFKKYEETQKKADAKLENIASDQSVLTQWIRKNLSTEEIQEFNRLYKEEKGKIKTEFEANETVYDQYELVDGRAELKKDSKLSEDMLTHFERRVHKINHQLHGIYNLIDQNRLKQSMIGDLLLQFRSWMRPNWNRYFGGRFGRTKFDEGLGTWQKGAYVSLYDYLAAPKKDNALFYGRAEGVTVVDAVTNLMGDYLKLIRNFRLQYAILPEYEKANIRRALANLAQIVGVTATLLLLGKLAEGEDDDEPLFALAFAIYELNMIHSEITQFLVPYGIAGMINRTKQSVAPSERVMRDLYQLTSELFAHPFRDEEERLYQAGVYRGQSKLGTAFRKSTPFIRQYHKHKNIPTFTAWYDLHNPFSFIYN
jgi:hypothetical protein